MFSFQIIECLLYIFLFIGYLHSNDESVRSEAANACKILSLKSSDSNVIISIMKQLFDVFNGANGKLTLAEHKTGLLLVILIYDGLITKYCIV